MYAAALDFPFHFGGIAKFDLTLASDGVPLPSPEGCLAGHFRHGAGRYGSEPVFVPRRPGEGEGELEEDDGYLLNFVHDTNTE